LVDKYGENLEGLKSVSTENITMGKVRTEVDKIIQFGELPDYNSDGKIDRLDLEYADLSIPEYANSKM
jgi:hypothetical protein